MFLDYSRADRKGVKSENRKKLKIRKELSRWSSRQLLSLLLNYDRLDLQATLAILRSGDLRHNLAGRRLVRIAGAVCPALNSLDGFGVAGCIELKRFVSHKECERCSGAGKIAGGGTLLLIVADCIDEPSLPGFGQRQCGKHSQKRKQRNTSSHLSVPP